MTENKSSHRKQFIQGTCLTMCPEKEIIMRESEGLLHKLEIDINHSADRRPRADRNRVVKCYCRPSAGQKYSSSSELRAAPVLLKTVTYLLRQIAADKHLKLPYNDIYDFVFDRLRAVRFDMVVQRIEVDSKIKILEPIVRFYAYAAYRLCEEPVLKFDPVINSDHLRDCIKELLVLYDESESIQSNQSEMEALYLAFCPGRTEGLMRYLQLASRLRDPVLKSAYEFSLSCYIGNYVVALRLLQKLPVLHSCIAALHVPNIRRKALQVMNCAYSSKNLIYPTNHLSNLLLCKDIVEECRHYGIKADAAHTTFCKGHFNSQVKVKSTSRLEIVDDKLKSCRLEDLLLGKESI